MSASVEEALLYVRAEGHGTPPLLLTPPPSWTMKTFARIALSTLRVEAGGVWRPVNKRTGAFLDPGTPVGELDALPYDVVEFRREP